MSSFLNNNLTFLILQFLDEDKHKETLHKLEKESGLYFNMNYFEGMITNGDFDEAEEYLKGFTTIDANGFSIKTVFEMRKQKYLEALDKGETAKAVDILVKQLKPFATYNDALFNDMVMLLTMDNFRENEHLSAHGDAHSVRTVLVRELKQLIEANPLIHHKLRFPTMKTSRLRTLINQSLNWQHQLCRSPNPNPDIKTLYEDHVCVQTNNPRPQLPPSVPVTGPMLPRPRGFSPIGNPNQQPSAQFPSSHAQQQQPSAQFPSSSSQQQQQSAQLPSSRSQQQQSSVQFPSLHSQQQQSAQIPSSRQLRMANPTLGCSSSRSFASAFGNDADSGSTPKRARPLAGIHEEVNVPLPEPVMDRGQSSSANNTSRTFIDIPRHVATTLDQTLSVKSLDFHPFTETLLLVGTNVGEVSAWEVGTRRKLASRSFHVWDLSVCSMILQATLANGGAVSVKRIKWNLEGTAFGVAYSKHIVQIFFHDGSEQFRNHIEIDAHIGSVNDIAFSRPNDQPRLVTCGEDKTVKVWDPSNGARLYSFEGHAAPVCSVSPDSKNDINYVLSSSSDGTIKAWLYESNRSKIDYETPGRVHTAFNYSADGTRLFSCGYDVSGESFIVEWDDDEGDIKRQYIGLGRKQDEAVQFDTVKNRFLVAGDDSTIKYWDMDNASMLASFTLNSLPACPCVSSSKDGKLVAVSTADNKVAILANNEGFRLFNYLRGQSASTVQATGQFGRPSSVGGTGVSANVQPQTSRPSPWAPTEVQSQSQLRALRIPNAASPTVKLLYKSSGNTIIALAHNGEHKMWKWQITEENATGTATTAVPPELWSPPSGIVMTNDISQTNLEQAVPCLEISKTDLYLMSSSGGKISLFNTSSFKRMATILAPAAATCLALMPRDNNIVAAGMQDASIMIYDVSLTKVLSRLRGHRNRVTGLAFSSDLNLLVSSAADQICAWSVDGWENKASAVLQFLQGRVPSSSSKTKVQFHLDQTRVLVVHEMQIAIYAAPKLECIRRWSPADATSLITDSTFSCDGQLIYAAFQNGSIFVFTLGMKIRCKISPAAYLPPTNPTVSSSGSTRDVFPVAVAAHPSKPNQIALGLKDGGVCVLEPLEDKGKWGDDPPTENVASTSNVASAG